MNDLTSLGAQLEDAVAEVLRAHGAMAATFVIVSESIEAETGERCLLTSTSEGAKPWTTLGLLEYALQVERAGIARDAEDDE